MQVRKFTTITALNADMKQFLVTTGLKSLLDVGCGIAPWDWLPSVITVGVDAYEAYLRHPRCAALDGRVLGDIRNGLPFGTGAYGVVWMSDVIEHLTKADGWRLLSEAQRVAGMGVVVRSPIGFVAQTSDAWGLGGDTWQTHRSGWTVADFTEAAVDVGTAWIIPPCPGHRRVWYRPGWFAVWLPTLLAA